MVHSSTRTRSAPTLVTALFGLTLAGCGGSTVEQPTPPLAPDPPGDAPQDPSSPVEPLDERIRFADVSTEAGIVDRGVSFGASIGDVDGDGWPDIFATGHASGRTRLWRNNGDGTFEDLAKTYFTPAPPEGDLHGGQWVDLDSDGRDELVLTTGACFGTCQSGNFCFYHQAGRLVDRSAAIGLDAPLMRGRTPLALDATADGRLDVLMTAYPRGDGLQSSELFTQTTAGAFQSSAPSVAVDLLTSRVEFGLLGDLDDDRVVDLLIPFEVPRAFSFVGGMSQEITDTIELPSPAFVRDACIADLTGDGRNEIYFARRRARSGFHVGTNGDLEARFFPIGGTVETLLVPPPRGDRFSSLHIQHGTISDFPASNVFFGAGNTTFTSNDVIISPAAASGMPSFQPGVDKGIYVGWDPATQLWSISVSTPNFAEGHVRLPGWSGDASAIVVNGFDPSDNPLADVLLQAEGGTYTDITTQAGLDTPLETRSVVAADFDNDMDLDLYVVVGAPTHNPANVVYENAGNGTFQIADAPGAEGTTAGVGDTVATLDYDRDGRIDLLLTNGPESRFRFLSEQDAFSDDGPTQLLRNRTRNENHWIGVELVGTASPRSAIGARVTVTTADGTRQIREQTGGMHRYTQNSTTLHFGLGRHETAATLEVEWPNGSTSTLTHVDGDRYVTVVE